MIDIIILLPLVYGLARGIMRGLIKEVIGLFSLLIAFVCAKEFAGDMAVIVQSWFTWETDICKTISFLFIFFATSIILSAIGWLLTRLLHAIHLGWLNRLFGGLFGVLKWTFVVSIILNCIDFLDEHFHFIQPDIKHTSYTYEPVRKVTSVFLAAWDEAAKES